MRACREFLALAIAALWVAAGSHCLLEALPGLEFLACCQHSEAEKPLAHHDQDCDGDACATIESGFYKAEQQQLAPEKPLPSLATCLTVVPDTVQSRALGSPVFAFSSPPELHRIWQFTQRTALPPRAPASAS
jgi:hypothetical protein